MTEAIVPQDGSVGPPEWSSISAEMRRIFQIGEEALQTNRRGLQRVFEIGAAMDGLRIEAMREAHTNNPIGKAYNAAWNRLATPLPIAKTLNKNDRKQYIQCYQKRDRIETWWQTLSDKQRDRWNHPDAILKNFYKEYPDEKPITERTKTTTTEPKLSLREDNAKLRQELEEAKRKIRILEKDNDAPGFTRSASPEEIHRVMSEYLNPYKYKKYLGIALGKQSSTAPQLRIKKSESE